jgi:hypothetical protein
VAQIVGTVISIIATYAITNAQAALTTVVKGAYSPVITWTGQRRKDTAGCGVAGVIRAITGVTTDDCLAAGTDTRKTLLAFGACVAIIAITKVWRISADSAVAFIKRARIIVTAIKRAAGAFAKGADVIFRTGIAVITWNGIRRVHATGRGIA